MILASGLDSRAYRLAWPTGTTVYEIDQPEVIEFKTRTLAELGAEPTANRRTVAIDLRYDWPSALIEEGFDPNQPTAWSAEGLLGYLPPDAQDRLLDTITELSAPGSRFATESVPNIDPDDHEKAIERMQDASERWRDHGFDLDFAELVYLGDRNEAAAYLGEHGWQLNRHSVKELFAAHGLPPIRRRGRRQLRRAAVHQRQPEGGHAMSRTDADSWDLASSVGATATMVAAARALASREPDALIDDPFAAPLVRAVGVDFFTKSGRRRNRLVGSTTATAAALMTDCDGGAHAVLRRLLHRRGAAGIRQAVILASGLDSRPTGCRGPTGTVVYEIDQPKVIEFKTATMTDDRRDTDRGAPHGRPSTCARTGRPRCAAAGSTTASRRRGAPRACWSTCRPRPRTGCSTTSPRSARRAVNWPPSTTPTAVPSIGERAATMR